MGHKSIRKIELKGKKSILAFSSCFLLFFFSFLFPVAQMAYWTIKFPKYFQDIDLWTLNFNTLLLVFLASSCLIVLRHSKIESHS